jgi:putative Holliday junction resolvase
LAIDYGRKRFGLALASFQARLANPLGILPRKNRREDLRRLRDLARKHAVKTIVVGLPLRTDGARGDMAVEAERFAARLRKHTALPVEMQDERLTSFAAQQLVARNNASRGGPQLPRMGGSKRAGQFVDAIAAALILRDYLERAPSGKEPE